MIKTKLPKTKWILAPYHQEIVNRLSNVLKIPDFVATVLTHRGIIEPMEAYDFLHPSLQNLHDPFLLKSMDQAISRIRNALRKREKILICGDYDVDGITSAALLKKCLSVLGTEVYTHLPNRLADGYGFHIDAVNYACSLDVKLIITVDCGITSREAVDYSREKDIDVIITDHHEPNGPLPAAIAILNPKRPDHSYPDQNLAGIGVAFKLSQALIKKGLLQYPLSSLLELVALGTVADVAQLNGENRIMVHFGLESLTHTSNPGLRALMDIASVAKWKKLDPVAIGYQIGPRINAVGRLGIPNQALKLLMTHSPQSARTLANELNRLNHKRQSIEEEILNNAENQIESMNLEDDPVIVVAGEEWHEGVIGIVASRITEKYFRPSCVITIKDGMGKGSGRSIPAFNLFECLTELSDLLTEFGGHQIAAGFKIKSEQIEKFRKASSEIAKAKMNSEDFIPVTSVDSELDLNDLSFDTIRSMDRLAPFGLGNPKPRFLIRNLRKRYTPRQVGSDGHHLKMTLTNGKRTVDAIAFGFGRYWSQISTANGIDVIATPEINVWQNRELMQLHIHDIHPFNSNPSNSNL